MPYLSQQGFSQAQDWVRVRHGWVTGYTALREAQEKVTSVSETECRSKPPSRAPPRIFITRKNSRERKMQISFGQALKDLGMSEAARDTRRFSYVCKLLSCVAEKLARLSGTALTSVLTILQDLIDQAVASGNNVHMARSLLAEYHSGLRDGYDGRVGSSGLWLRHTETVRRLQHAIDSLQIPQRQSDGLAELGTVPDDCVRQVLLRLDRHEDLVSFSLSHTRGWELTAESWLWERLCRYHFSPAQIDTVLAPGRLVRDLGWQVIYHRLLRHHGRRECFADMLCMCNNCNSVFWQRLGHECVFPDLAPVTVPLSPKNFMEIFINAG